MGDLGEESPELEVEPSRPAEGRRTQKIRPAARGRFEGHPLAGVTIGVVLSLVFLWLPVAVIWYLFARG